MFAIQECGTTTARGLLLRFETSKGKYLIARCSTTASDEPSVEFNGTLERKIVMMSTPSSVCAPVKIISFGKSDCFMT